MQKRMGSEILADALKNNGVDLVYHVPGESFISVLDSLGRHHASIRQVSCRHEGGMTVMAEAYGKLTGRPGIAFVTRGPGATNAASGIHTAFQDSSPMILFVGQVIRSQMEREAFQAYDFRQMFAPMAKWVAQIDDASRIPEKAYPSEPGLTTCWVCGCHWQYVRLMFWHAQPLERRPPDVPRHLRGALSR